MRSHWVTLSPVGTTINLGVPEIGVITARLMEYEAGTDLGVLPLLDDLLFQWPLEVSNVIIFIL